MKYSLQCASCSAFQRSVEKERELLVTVTACLSMQPSLSLKHRDFQHAVYPILLSCTLLLQSYSFCLKQSKAFSPLFNTVILEEFVYKVSRMQRMLHSHQFSLLSSLQHQCLDSVQYAAAINEPIWMNPLLLIKTHCLPFSSPCIVPLLSLDQLCVSHSKCPQKLHGNALWEKLSVDVKLFLH